MIFISDSIRLNDGDFLTKMEDNKLNNLPIFCYFYSDLVTPLNEEEQVDEIIGNQSKVESQHSNQSLMVKTSNFMQISKSSYEVEEDEEGYETDYY